MLSVDGTGLEGVARMALYAFFVLSHELCGTDVTLGILHQGKPRHREGRWFGQGHTAGSQHLAAQESPRVTVFRFQPQLDLRPAVALRLRVPSCKVAVTHHAGVSPKSL